MQRRIVDGIQGIWKTIKNEIFGPKINKKTLNIFKCTTQKINTEFSAKIKINSEKTTPDIKNINDNFEIEVRDISFPDTVIKCNLLTEVFKLGNQSFNLIFQNYSIKKLEQGSFELKVINLKLDSINKNGKKIILDKNIKIPFLIKKDKKLQTINKVPKKVKCEHLGRYSKQELIRILKKAKMKRPKMDMTSFVIEAFFKNIPVGSIQNLKYDNKTKNIYLYFNSKKADKTFKDFVIFKNKLEQNNVKIFI